MMMVIMVCVAVIAFAIRVRVGIPFVMTGLVGWLVGWPWIIRRPIWWWGWAIWRW